MDVAASAGEGRWGCERGEHIGAAALAGDGAVAMLSHGDACRGAGDGHGGGDVERIQSIAASSADVKDDAGTSGVVPLSVARRTSSLANAANSSAVSPFSASAVRKSAASG